MSEPLRPDDPAYWMLERGKKDPSWRSTKTVHLDGCYICEDPEFALMGLPLCQQCPQCQRNGQQGHIAADDTMCDICAFDLTEEYYRWGKEANE